MAKPKNDEDAGEEALEKAEKAFDKAASDEASKSAEAIAAHRPPETPKGKTIPFGKGVAPSKPVTLEEYVAQAGGNTVTMTIPTQPHKGPVLLKLLDRRLLAIPTGIVQVPADLAEHWYLKAAGAEIYKK